MSRGAVRSPQFGQQEIPDTGGIYDGTVGWDDGSEHFDIEDGVTLVRVTLYEGISPVEREPSDTTRARGHRILARISAPMYQVPPDGATVVIAIPAKRWGVPGGGVIIAQPVSSPDIQFSGTRMKIDVGPDMDLVLKGRSVTISDYEDRYLTLHPEAGIKAGDGDGSGFALKDGQWTFYACADGTAHAALVLAENKLMATTKNGLTTQGFKFAGGTCTVMCQQYANMAGGGQLGAAASPTSGIQYGPGIGIPSTTWKIQS